MRRIGATWIVRLLGAVGVASIVWLGAAGCSGDGQTAARPTLNPSVSQSAIAGVLPPEKVVEGLNGIFFQEYGVSVNIVRVDRGDGHACTYGSDKSGPNTRIVRGESDIAFCDGTLKELVITESGEGKLKGQSEAAVWYELGYRIALELSAFKSGAEHMCVGAYVAAKQANATEEELLAYVKTNPSNVAAVRAAVRKGIAGAKAGKTVRAACDV